MTKPNRIQTPMRNCLFGKILLKKSSNDNFVDVCNDVEEFTNIEELFKVSTGYWPNPLRVLTMSALLTLLAEAKRDAGQSPVAARCVASRGSGAFTSQTNRFVPATSIAHRASGAVLSSQLLVLYEVDELTLQFCGPPHIRCTRYLRVFLWLAGLTSN